MDLIKVFENNSASIEAAIDFKYIQISWIKHPESHTFRKIILTALDFADQHNLTKWLCDMQQIIFLEIEDQQWLINDIFTAFNPNYIHEYAYVISPMVSELLTTYHIQELVQAKEDLNNKINVEIFFEVDVAQQWLFSPVKQSF